MNATTTTYRIVTSVLIKSARPEFGDDTLTPDSYRALCDAYESDLEDAIQAAYPEADVKIDIDRMASGGIARHELTYDDGGESRDDADLREISGRVWMGVCENWRKIIREAASR